jgi:Uma2 family endonuclease
LLSAEEELLAMSVFAQDDALAVERPAAAVPDDLIWRLTVPEYHEMIRAGILTEDDPVELLDGWLVAKMMKKPPHCVATDLVRYALESILPKGWRVRIQDAVTLATSEPEPDAVVVHGGPRDFVDHHPGPKDIALVVEVADISLKRDQKFKKRLYAQAGIPAYWIVNLVDRRVEVYSEPSGPADQPDYRQHRDCGPTDEVPVVVERREVGRIAVGAILP